MAPKFSFLHDDYTGESNTSPNAFSNHGYSQDDVVKLFNKRQVSVDMLHTVGNELFEQNLVPDDERKGIMSQMLQCRSQFGGAADHLLSDELWYEMRIDEVRFLFMSFITRRMSMGRQINPAADELFSFVSPVSSLHVGINAGSPFN